MRVKQHIREGRVVRQHDRKPVTGKTGKGKEYVQVLRGKSSFIDSITHSGTTLVMKFKDGRQYISTGVSPDTMRKVSLHVKRYGSMGKAFHKYIKGNFSGKKLN